VVVVGHEDVVPFRTVCVTWHALFLPFLLSSHERPGAFRMQEDVVVHTVFYLALNMTVRYGGLRTTR